MRFSSKNRSRRDPASQPKPWRKTLLWIIISVLVAALSIWAVLQQAQELSLRDIVHSVRQMQPLWLAAAVACMLLYIISEACAIRTSCALLQVRCPARKSLVYSATDIYFSAITPSSTGGQPASALIMIQDGIPAMKSTAVLLMNLSLYSVSVILITAVCLVLRPGIFWHFGLFSRILIITGCVAQLLLAVFLVLLVKDEKHLSKLGFGAIHLLKKMHLIRREDHLKAKFQAHMDQYEICAGLFAARRQELWQVFVYEFLQRASQVTIPMCLYLAMGGGTLSGGDVWVLQSLILIGANYVPIPGGMGVTDYLMLDGFSSFLTSSAAVRLEVLSRSLSFYVCILLCALLILIRFALQLYRRRKAALTQEP